MPIVWGSNLCGVTAAEVVHHAVPDVRANLHAGGVAPAAGHCVHWGLCHSLQHVWRHLSCGIH